ncbi:MAG: translation initiation factor IF-3 [bacterium]
MRKSFRGHFKPQQEVKDFRLNMQIKSPILRVINEDGHPLGELTLSAALAKAEEAGLDLVEVSPKATPPVAKIMDYGRHRYQTEKMLQKQKARQKKIDIKGVRLSLRISDHDRETKLNQAKKFLAGGDKLKIELILKGREKQMFPLAKEIVNNFITAIKAEIPVKIEQPLSAMGGRLSVILTK